MAYYPKSQVKTNLYTNGGEYTTTSNQFSTVAESYIGYYYKTSTGQLYTGKNPQEKPSLLLYAFEPLLSNIEVGAETETLPTNLIVTNILEPKYSYNSAITSPTRSIPQFSLTLPTVEDKKRGYFMRYFCKKNNELIYYETSKNDYDRTKNQDSTMAYDLYSVLALQWSFTGDPSQVANFNISSITRASSLNNWTGFIQYFKGNYTQYLGS
jgi:hypothetical protein